MCDLARDLTREHACWDKSSSVYKYSQAKNIEVVFEDFNILERGYPKYLDRIIFWYFFF